MQSSLVESEILVGHPSGDALGEIVCGKLEAISSHKHWHGCPQHAEGHRNIRVEEIGKQTNKQESPG